MTTATALSARIEETFRLRAVCAELESRALRRERIALDGAQGITVEIDGRALLNFSGNDYLGLAADPRLVAALRDGAARFGVGAGASPLVCGRSRAHDALERRIAAFTGRERAMLFCSGYMANLALGLSGLVGPRDLVVEDRLNHASLIDAARAAGARLRRYTHGNAAAAAALLRAGAGRKLLVTDGVFSMDGDLAPVAELARHCRAAGALLAVDDAHGLGVLGPGGRGVLTLAGADADDVPILIGTFGKAFGTAGAFIAGAADLIDYLYQRARTYVYSTAPPPALAYATCRAIDIVEAEPERIDTLRERVEYFRAGATRLQLPLLPSSSPIQPVPLGSSARAVAIGGLLRQAGVLVATARPPTVPEGTARLRITLSAAHEHKHIDRLLGALASALRDAT
jgi:8-amino-7-oxononanoate synthase